MEDFIATITLLIVVMLTLLTKFEFLAQKQLQCTLSLILLYYTYGHNDIVWSIL